MTQRRKPSKAADLRVIQMSSSLEVEGDLRVKRRETPAERDQRLRKEGWSFVVDDLLARFIAFVVLIALVAISTVILFRSTLPEDRHFATSTLAAVGTAVVGFAFGRATKKSA